MGLSPSLSWTHPIVTEFDMQETYNKSVPVVSKEGREDTE